MDKEEKNLGILIGKFVSQNRLNLGLSQDNLAEKANIDNSTLSQIENGKRIPKLRTFFKIFKILKYSSEDKKDHFKKDLNENFDKLVQNILCILASGGKNESKS